MCREGDLPSRDAGCKGAVGSGMGQTVSDRIANRRFRLLRRNLARAIGKGRFYESAADCHDADGIRLRPNFLAVGGHDDFTGRLEIRADHLDSHHFHDGAREATAVEANVDCRAFTRRRIRSTA